MNRPHVSVLQMNNMSDPGEGTKNEKDSSANQGLGRADVLELLERIREASLP